MPFKSSLTTDNNGKPIEVYFSRKIGGSVGEALKDFGDEVYEGTFIFKTGRNYNSSSANWTVPSKVKWIMVRTCGAGGEAGNYPNSFPDSNGGAGGYAQGIMQVTAGQVLKVAVGTNTNNGYGPGSYAHGSGFTGILTGPDSPTDPVFSWTSHIIADGGGGGAINKSNAGGAGGGPSGQPGYGPSPRGSGASQSSGGTGGSPGPQDGSYLKGGPGGNSGGGAGYFGGGGSSGPGGGGGGSGRIDGPGMQTSDPFSLYAGGSGRSASPYASSFYEYPLLGQAPVNPTQPFGAGGSGANINNRSYRRNNGYVMIHCFSSNFVPSVTDLPDNLGGYTVATP